MLLISADFFASDFIHEDELPPLLDAAQAKGVRILPVIISASRFARHPDLSRFLGVNLPDKPLDGMSKADQEKVLDCLAEEIRKEITQPPPPPPPTDCPYPGLAPFTSEQAPFFFGRNGETDQLVRRLQNPDRRFIAIVGASGTGKSSLIYAGLIPRLRAGKDIKGSETWPVMSFKPSDNPFLALATQLKPLLPNYNGSVNDLAKELEMSPAKIKYFAEQALAQKPAFAKLVFFH